MQSPPLARHTIPGVINPNQDMGMCGSVRSSFLSPPTTTLLSFSSTCHLCTPLPLSKREKRSKLSLEDPREFFSTTPQILSSQRNLRSCTPPMHKTLTSLRAGVAAHSPWPDFTQVRGERKIFLPAGHSLESHGKAFVCFSQAPLGRGISASSRTVI